MPIVFISPAGYFNCVNGGICPYSNFVNGWGINICVVRMNVGLVKYGVKYGSY